MNRMVRYIPNVMLAIREFPSKRTHTKFTFKKKNLNFFVTDYFIIYLINNCLIIVLN